MKQYLPTDPAMRPADAILGGCRRLARLFRRRAAVRAEELGGAPHVRRVRASWRLTGWLALTVWLTGCGLAEDEQDEKNKFSYITFSDAALERYCLREADLDGDGRISLYEAQRVVRMDCSGCGIASMYDIGEFTNLQRLDCSRNELAELDVRRLARLERLDCSQNRLERLEVEGLRALTSLVCSENRLTTLNLGASASLVRFEARANAFPTLDLRGCATTLTADVTGNPSLETIYGLRSQSIAADGQTQIVFP